MKTRLIRIAIHFAEIVNQSKLVRHNLGKNVAEYLEYKADFFLSGVILIH